ncbi:ATP-dependent DNA helicase RecG [Breznakia blatticola]|uniref:ATP-dependent DNA helicase RecG n=1 Tax=Breznakia blatticola TaxID=1754012 RepID=A0A4R7ZRF0_9FIRM|nr:ATP-binding protein [Breznakia blatticola]TDW20185.1 ATP-dependent DNA helicase RecG [Breznakia blatticola]
MKESRTIEYKEKVSNTFLKTVSAYANYGSGEIIFGITDEGKTVGLSNPEAVCLDIENKINDAIKPGPTFTLTINQTNKTVTLFVEEGISKPFLYKGKAYKRNDTSTIEVDHIELKRLIMIGENVTFDELPCIEENLTFEYLYKKVQAILGVEKTNVDTLKTLGLFASSQKYNNAAELLADNNNFPGIDVIRTESSLNKITFRETISNVSILKQFDRIDEIFTNFYKIEEIVGMQRNEVYMVPKEAFREAIANAIVHRTWDVNAHIRITMYEDKIEIMSPGGLPAGISKEEYLNGFISTPRNPIIANVFFRLHIIEMFGTGIRRIKMLYKNIRHKPIFVVSSNSISITLPSVYMKEQLSIDEQIIVDLLSNGLRLSSSEIAKKVEFSKDKVVRLVHNLIDKNYIVKEGTGRGTKYRIN